MRNEPSWWESNLIFKHPRPPKKSSYVGWSPPCSPSSAPKDSHTSSEHQIHRKRAEISRIQCVWEVGLCACVCMYECVCVWARVSRRPSNMFISEASRAEAALPKSRDKGSLEGHLAIKCLFSSVCLLSPDSNPDCHRGPSACLPRSSTVFPW